MPWNDKDVLTPQALNSRSGLVFNVKDPDFGAVGDGVTDDTAAIQATIDATVDGSLGFDATLAAQGSVYFPPGDYNHTGLTYQGSPWIGAGRYVSRLMHTGTGASVDAVGSAGARRDLRIQDLQLNGTNALAGSYGLRIGFNQRSTGALQRVQIDSFPSYGILFDDDTWQMSFNDVYLVRCATTEDFSAIAIGAANNIAHINWYGLQLENNGKAASGIAGGMDLTGFNALTKWSFFGPIFQGNLGDAEVRFTDAQALSIHGLYMESGLAAAGAIDGIIFAGATEAALVAPRITAVTSHGGSAIRAIGTSVVSLDAPAIHANWPTHVDVEDTAQVVVLSPGDMDKSKNAVEAGAILQQVLNETVGLTDAATITVNAALGDFFAVTLTDDRTMGVPTNPSEGQRITFLISQDGSGGHALTFDASIYKDGWSDTGNTLDLQTSISFRFHGNRWRQDGAQSPYYST